MIVKISKYHLSIILLFCILQLTIGIDAHAQEAAAKRKRISNRKVEQNDSLASDSLTHLRADSLLKVNQKNLKQLTSKTETQKQINAVQDSIQKRSPVKQWIPDSGKATWLALVFPGGGQIYNRKYWKLPIIYGGFAGCAYALTWNNKMYKDYSQAYMDIMDDDPTSNSFLELLPPNSNYTESQLQTILKKRKDTYRRYRDMSIFAFVGVYIISVIDAYVDAELSNFDITPDLSMHLEPTIINDRHKTGNSVGIQCSLRF
ncbi:DUF5683 domain-containing protein [uncultured Bacteroides sp.]|uniref:DUF5683 domain-containing protein n=1 Tax=uncultured Bacteroides sp. TaxID=162156 RepID=UPI002AAAD067|nr:DUF5683 domain-containing protein [uncultured Bacteroides sp.]